MRSPCALPAHESPYPRVALISFMGYAIGHNVGFNSISGGAVRYRAYTALGLSAGQIATIIAFGTLTFFLGASLLLGVSLLSNAGMSGSVLHVHAWLARARRRLVVGGGGRVFVAGMHPPCAAAVSQNRDSRAESARRVRADRHQLRRYAVRGRRSIRIAAARKPRSAFSPLPASTCLRWPRARSATFRAASACSSSSCCC